jgi:phage protein U
MPMQKKIELKGVIPPTLTTIEEQLEALRDLREFLQQFPGLGEEVMKDREQRRQEEDRALAERNRFYFRPYLNSIPQEVSGMSNDKNIELKGVIPPKDTSSEALIEAIRELREFVRQFPGLGEEVMKTREQEQQQQPYAPSH